MDMGIFISSSKMSMRLKGNLSVSRNIRLYTQLFCLDCWHFKMCFLISGCINLHLWAKIDFLLHTCIYELLYFYIWYVVILCLLWNFDNIWPYILTCCHLPCICMYTSCLFSSVECKIKIKARSIEFRLLIGTQNPILVLTWWVWRYEKVYPTL